MARATLDLRCPSPQAAKVLWEAVEVDDPESVVGTVEGNVVVIKAGPAPVASLRITLDDLLACIQVASGASTTTRDEEGDR